MGLYTNPSFSNGYVSSSYTSVEPFKGEHFNYHELGIIAATESASNRDAFMKAIALNELASVEQYGTDQVFYESVNLGSVFDRIKAFFKKIIEKIHKIFHTFIAKLGSWFQSSKEFAKKYEKEIIKKWGLVKNDWEFKGYVFKCLPGKNASIATEVDATKNNIISPGGTKVDEIEALINTKSAESLKAALEHLGTKTKIKGDNQLGNLNSGSDADNAGAADERAKVKEALRKAKDDLDNWKEQVRGSIVKNIKEGSGGVGKGLATLEMVKDAPKYDAKEFTEELFKVFRSDEDSKVDVKLSELGSATEVINNIKDFDKVKEQTEKLEKAMVKSIDNLIDAISKAQDALIKENNTTGSETVKLDNEVIISATSFYQSCWGFIKEAQTQAFGACIQALKDRCAQDKEVCVKIIGSSKKMTEESVDYSNYSDGGNFNSFIESVKLV